MSCVYGFWISISINSHFLAQLQILGQGSTFGPIIPPLCFGIFSIFWIQKLIEAHPTPHTLGERCDPINSCSSTYGPTEIWLDADQKQVMSIQNFILPASRLQVVTSPVTILWPNISQCHRFTQWKKIFIDCHLKIMISPPKRGELFWNIAD